MSKYIKKINLRKIKMYNNNNNNILPLYYMKKKKWILKI
jgi:predicted DNA-binding protein (MmcQ/YjbR family)